MEKFGRRETYKGANMINLIAALVTSNLDKTFYATLPIRISPVYTNIVMFCYIILNLWSKKKKKGKIKCQNSDFALICTWQRQSVKGLLSLTPEKSRHLVKENIPTV